MNCFVSCFVCFILLACSVYAALSNDVVASYVDAFEKYQVRFNKHYNTKGEYDRRLRAYAVCSIDDCFVHTFGHT